MECLKDGFVYYQSKLDLRKNGILTEREYDFIDEVKRSCAFYFYENDKRYVITASYANMDKTPPEYYISDMRAYKRQQMSCLETAKEEVRRLVADADYTHNDK